MSILPVDDGYQRSQYGRNVPGHPVPKLHGDLPRGPGGVVTHGDVLGVQVTRQDGHKVCEIVS